MSLSNDKTDNNFVDEDYLKNFINLISKKFSFSSNNEVWINTLDLAKTFDINLMGDDFEFGVQNLFDILKKINNLNLGVKVKKVFFGINGLTIERVQDFEKFKKPKPATAGEGKIIAFKK